MTLSNLLIELIFGNPYQKLEHSLILIGLNVFPYQIKEVMRFLIGIIKIEVVMGILIKPYQNYDEISYFDRDKGLMDI